jgi:sterol desaturase/sphingolipid hydroxylase (fatty acid hydroxylase superfamily)
MEVFGETALLIWSTPVIVALIIAEVLWTHFHKVKAYTLKETLTNCYLAALNGSFDILMRGVVLVVMTFFYKHKLFDLGHGWTYWLLLFLAEDFAFYTLHCVDHFCRFFWAVHVTHHSSPEFNLSTGFRSSVFQPLYRVAYFAPLAWVGFQPMDVLLMYAATQIYGSLIHTERIKKMGWLEYILVTPSHHRVHHASNPRYLDKNMGMCLIIWDKIFGTFQPEDESDPPRYGITKTLTDRGPVNIVFHEWKDLFSDARTVAKNWRERLGFFLHGPGWKP